VDVTRYVYNLLGDSSLLRLVYLTELDFFLSGNESGGDNGLRSLFGSLSLLHAYLYCF